MKGGGLGCKYENCPKSYHVLCAKTTNALLVSDKWLMYCEEHREMAPEEHLEQEVVSDSEVDEYFCSICKSGLDEHIIVICDGCNKGYHANCHSPIIPENMIESNEDWFCSDC